MRIIYFLFSGCVLLACGGNKSKNEQRTTATTEWQEGYDSAKRFIADSLRNVEMMKMAYRKEQRRSLEYEVQEEKHFPPNDGHIHDNGKMTLSQLTAASQDFDAAVLAKVTDSAHVNQIALVPLIAKRGLIDSTDRYSRNVRKHTHVEYRVLTIPIYHRGNVIDSAVVAIALKKIPAKK